MRRLVVTKVGDDTEFDFDGFPGDTCSDEEDLFRLLMAKLGVDSDVEHSDNKRERQAEAETETNGPIAQ